jgi:hypothetical protein
MSGCRHSFDSSCPGHRPYIKYSGALRDPVRGAKVAFGWTRLEPAYLQPSLKRALSFVEGVQQHSQAGFCCRVAGALWLALLDSSLVVTGVFNISVCHYIR